jgi:hypothetical protein
VTIERIQGIAGEAESLLGTASRIHSKLFGPEPTSLGDTQKSPPPLGFFNAASSNLDVLHAVVTEALAILRDVEDRIEF